ncbi:MAG: PEP-CTERM sorting domain-containing protein [Phenylobacterium sp.]|uniref:NF038122 family metalloprotease n=1 Tax=Phenylobacterium sp. TaxID=1871053 RepID=UPI0025D10607|nr:NF038122 family metalloprotease [Phenylobacterium sp.]MBI1197474.1 PEP-CTERM sorting domain-containing protein [Phenylobacterium sp.]
MKLSKIGLFASGAVAAGALAFAAPASALTINLNDIGGVTGSPAELGFRAAAHYWESVFTNDATVNLNVGFSSLGANILGGTSSNLLQYVSVGSYYNALAATGTSALDAQAVANLSPLNSNGGLDVIVPGYLDGGAMTGIDDTTTRIAPDNAINETMAITTANARALGVDLGSTVDATVQFSSDFAFDFDPNDGISAGTYDFIGVAIHEIGHALGFVSGADDFDYSDGFTGDVDSYWWGYALDMFRYSDNGGNPMLDWTPGTDSYFSIDGGQTALMGGYFSTGTNFGDGWQASHWKEPSTPCQDFLGILNPYICNGIGDSVTSLDLALFDAIGWNVNFDVLANPNYSYSTAQARAAVPEPATWALMIMGFGLLGSALRRRQPALVRIAR